MEIRINDEPLDFTIENEQNLGEVVRGLRHWLEQRHCFIAGIKVDGRDFDPSLNGQIEGRPLVDVGRLEIAAGSIYGERIEALSTMMEYLERLLDALRGGRSEESSALLIEAPAVMESLKLFFPRIFVPGGVPSALEKAHSAAGKAGFTDRECEARQELEEFVLKLGILVRANLSELLHPELEAVSVLRALALHTEKVRDISVLLQTGRDAEAMRTLVAFSELIEKTMRLYSLLAATAPDRIRTEVEGRDFKSFIDELNSSLTSLVEAFTVQDSVLIGDALEYEIAPRVQKLPAFFNFS